MKEHKYGLYCILEMENNNDCALYSLLHLFSHKRITLKLMCLGSKIKTHITYTAKHTIVYSTIMFRMYESYSICLTCIFIYFTFRTKFIHGFIWTHNMLEKHQVKATQAPHTLVLREGRNYVTYICIQNHFVRCNIICVKATMSKIQKKN